MRDQDDPSHGGLKVLEGGKRLRDAVVVRDQAVIGQRYVEVLSDKHSTAPDRRGPKVSFLHEDAGNLSGLLSCGSKSPVRPGRIAETFSST
jgi:hypothetical protein